MKTNLDKKDTTLQELATYHCIIGHPQKAKFLAIRHQTGWSVPTLKLPLGSADFRAAAIARSVQLKYGLRTRVLRPLTRTSQYHCIELELCKGGTSKKLDAVWVGREQYQKFRSAGPAYDDPFDQWLQEKEQGIIPALRPAWQFPGWFDQADLWIHFQLEKIGLQVTGGVQQFRVGWNASCLLRVPTNEGLVYFKASYSRPPGEAALTPFLADRWPQYIARPLAVDRERNWMLTRDLAVGGKVSPQLSYLPGFARALATMQVGSMKCIDELIALGCPVRDLQFLIDWIAKSDELLPFLRAGQDALSEPEGLQLQVALAAHADCCRQLLECPIPSALVHNDFRDDNLAVQGDTLRIFDWTDAVIGHPFLALEYVNGPAATFHSEGAVSSPQDAAVKAIVVETNSAYLECFRALASEEQLQHAWLLAQSLFRLWNLFRSCERLKWIEKNSPGYVLLESQVKNNARKVIDAAKDLPGAAG